VRETGYQGEKTVETAVVQDQGVQVGDLFACSWGYDQTQVDFYEVTGVTPSGKSVKVKPVQQVRTSEPGPSETVAPVKGSAWGEATTHRIKDAGWNGKVKHAFKVSSYSTAYKGDWDGQWSVTGWGYGR
jgi:hypothetical protein